MPVPNFNTTATRDAATVVLDKAFPGGDKQEYRDLMDNTPTIITVEQDYDADSVSLGQMPSVCILKIWSGAELEDGVQPWLEIKWLGTDPDFKGQGYGMAAFRGALLYAQSHGAQDSFGVHADVTATDFYRKFMMAGSDALGEDSTHYDDDDVPVSLWMQGSIQTALSNLPITDIEVGTIDPGAYDAIRCKKSVSGRRWFTIHFTYDKCGWMDIKEVDQGLSVLNGTVALEVVLEDGQLRRLLKSHGITYDNILTAAHKSRNSKVSLNSGARTRSDTAENDMHLHPVQYRQEDIFASDDMCVVLAAANGVSRYSPVKAQQLMDAAPTGRQSFNRVADFLQNTVGIRTENLREITERSDVLKPDQGLLLCQLVDQNGTRGHAVTIDTDRGVIIDPAEENEMQLTKFNLNRSCGVASVCIGVTNVRKLNMPTDRPRKKQKSSDDATLIIAGAPFTIGSLELPVEFSLSKYDATYTSLHAVGYPYKSKSAPMSIFGGTIGPTGNAYKQDGIIMPRPNKQSIPGMPGYAALQLPHVIALAQAAEAKMITYLRMHDTETLENVLWFKANVPSELRVCGTMFNAMTLVGDLRDGENHIHVDNNDLCSLIVMFGSGISGGNTLYYDGHKAKQPGNLVHSEPFLHGKFQVGPFESKVHAGEHWTGRRGIISFYVNEAMFKHFQKYGTAKYDAWCARRRLATQST